MGSPRELEIINKKPIPKLDAVTTSTSHPISSNASDEKDAAIDSTERNNMLIRSTPVASEEIQ